jgi:hypothetical protein
VGKQDKKPVIMRHRLEKFPRMVLIEQVAMEQSFEKGKGPHRDSWDQ